MKIIFMGTPDFAVPSLEKLIEAGHEILAVFTQPDKPKGRGYNLLPPPVKVTAQKHNIPIFQPISLKREDIYEEIKKINPEVIVVVAYGKLLPKNILAFPKFGCVNVHGSLLPKYRGAAPMQWAILNGEKETGITTMLMAEGLDTGDMLLSEKTEIDETETFEDIHNKMQIIGANLLIKTLEELQNGTITPQKQDDSLSCYSPMITKDMCKISFEKPAQEVHNLIRALSPYPAAFAMVLNKRIKLFNTCISNLKGKPGEVLCLNPLTIACKNNAIEVKEVQIEGKKRVGSEDFLNGYKLKIGDFFE